MIKAGDYLKNITKSVMYSSKDVFASSMPSLSSFVSTNSDVLASMSNDLRNFRTSNRTYSNRLKSNSTFKSLVNIKNNALSDLKSGNWNNKVRQEADSGKMMGDMFGDFSMDFDFDMDDFDENEQTSLDNTVSAGDMAMMESSVNNANVLAAVTSASGQAIARTNIKSADLIIQNTNAIHATEMSVKYKMHGELVDVQSNMATSLLRLSDFTEQQASFMNKSMEMLEKQYNAINQSMLMQKANNEENAKLYKEYNKGKESKYKRSDLDNITDSNSQLDLMEYMKNVKKKSKDEFDSSMVGVAYSMMNMFGGSPLDMVASSPLQMLSDTVFKKMIPAGVDKSMKGLDKTIEHFTKSMMHKFSASAKEKEYEKPILGMLGKIFGIETGNSSTIRTSQYVKDAIPFDGITKQAIIEVMPTYLRQIASAVTGTPEKIYNYNTGKFMTVANARKSADSSMDGAYASTGSSRRVIKNRLGSLGLDKDGMDRLNVGIDEMFKTLTDTGIFYNPNDSENMYEQINTKASNKFDLSDDEFNVINEAIKSLGKNFAYSMEEDLLNSYTSKENTINRLNKQLGAEGSSAIYNESLNDKENGNNIFAGASYDNITRDLYGKSEHDYLRDIRNTLLEGIFTYGGGTSGPTNNVDYDSRASKYSGEIDKYKSNQKAAEKKANKENGINNPFAINNQGNKKSLDDIVYSDEDISSLFAGTSEVNLDGDIDGDNVKNVDGAKQKLNWNSLLKKFANGNSEREKLLNNIKMFTTASANAPGKIVSTALDSIASTMHGFVYGVKDPDEEQTVMERMFGGMSTRVDEFVKKINEDVFGPMKSAFTGENSVQAKVQKAAGEAAKKVATKVKAITIGSKADGAHGFAGGALSPIANMGLDAMNELKGKITGTDYVNSKGETIAVDTEQSLVSVVTSNVKETVAKTKESVTAFNAMTFGDAADGKIDIKHIYETKIKPTITKATGEESAIGKIISKVSPTLGIAGTTVMDAAGKVNESAANASKTYFGEAGKENRAAAKTKILEKIQGIFGKSAKGNILKGAGIGAVASLFTPFGLLGAGIVGGVAGLFSGTGPLKKFLYGEKNDANERKGGLLSKLFGWVTNKFAESKNKVIAEFTYFARKHFLNPLLDAFKPVVEEMKNIGNFIKEKTTSLIKYIFNGEESWLGKMAKKLFDNANKLTGGLLKAGSKLLLGAAKLPGALLNKITGKLVDKHEKQGKDYVENWRDKKQTRDASTEDSYQRAMDKIRGRAGENEGNDTEYTFRLREEQVASTMENGERQDKTNTILENISNMIKGFVLGEPDPNSPEGKKKAKKEKERERQKRKKAKKKKREDERESKKNGGNTNVDGEEGTGSINDFVELQRSEAEQEKAQKEEKANDRSDRNSEALEELAENGGSGGGSGKAGILASLLGMVGSGLGNVAGAGVGLAGDLFGTAATFLGFKGLSKKLGKGAAAGVAGGAASGTAGAAAGGVAAGAAKKGIFAKIGGVLSSFIKGGVGLLKKNPKTAIIATIATLIGGKILSGGDDKTSEQKANKKDGDSALHSAYASGQITDAEYASKLQQNNNQGTSQAQSIVTGNANTNYGKGPMGPHEPTAEELGAHGDSGGMMSTLASAGTQMVVGNAVVNKGAKMYNARKAAKAASSSVGPVSSSITQIAANGAAGATDRPGLLTKGMTTLKGMITKIMNSAPVKAVAKSKVGAVLGKISTWLITKLTPMAATIMPKLTAKWAVILGGGALTAGTFAVAWIGGNVTNGMTKARQIFRVGAEFKMNAGLTMMAGIAHLIDTNVTFGMIPETDIVDFIAGTLLSDAGAAELEQAQNEFLSGYAAYANIPGNSNASFDEFNRYSNPSMVESAMDTGKKFMNTITGGSAFKDDMEKMKSVDDDMPWYKKLGTGVMNFFGMETKTQKEAKENSNSEEGGFGLGNTFNPIMPKRKAVSTVSIRPTPNKISGYQFTDSPEDIRPTNLNGLPYYSQNDPRWSSRKYGTSDMAGSACGPTSMAMLSSAVSGKLSDPVTMADWAVDNGHRVPNVGTSWSFFGAAGKNLNTPIKQVTADEAEVALREGRPVIISGKGAPPFTRGGHFITAFGMQGDKVLILDPVSQDRSILYPWVDIKASARAYFASNKVSIMQPTGGITDINTKPKKTRDEGGFGNPTLNNANPALSQRPTPSTPSTSNITNGANPLTVNANPALTQPTAANTFRFANSPENIRPTNLNGLPYYSQKDSRWGSKKYGTSDMAGSACGPTSMAMLSSAVSGKLHDPVTMANWAVANGYRVPNVGTSWGFFGAMGKNVNTPIKQVTATQAEEALRAGRPVVISGKGAPPFTTGGHFVTAFGMQGDKVLILDPVSQARSIMYPWADIKKSAKAYFASDKVGVMQPTGYNISPPSALVNSDSNSDGQPSEKKMSFMDKVSKTFSDIGALTMGLFGSALTGTPFDPNEILEPNNIDGPDQSSKPNSNSSSNVIPMPSIAGSAKYDFDFDNISKIGTSNHGDPVYGKTAIRSLSSNRGEVISAMAPYAMIGQEQHGVPASTFIAQSIQETGGTSVIGNNMHGIKAYKGIGQPVVKTKTQEHGIGTITDTFFGYDSLAKGAEGYYNFMQGSNYKNVKSDDWQSSLGGLTKYATDPNYIPKLKEIVKSNDLLQFNEKAPSFYASNNGQQTPNASNNGGNTQGGFGDDGDDSIGGFHVNRASTSSSMNSFHTQKNTTHQNCSTDGLLSAILEAILKLGLPLHKISGITELISKNQLNNKTMVEQNSNPSTKNKSKKPVATGNNNADMGSGDISRAYKKAWALAAGK